jgi:hypothetical protein
MMYCFHSNRPLTSRRIRRLPRWVGLLLCLLPILLPAGCASDGGSGGRNGGESPEIVKGGVVFRYYDTEVSRVNLVGDFNNWSQTSDPMTDKNNDGEWSLFYPLAPGSYEYKFVLDGTRWVPDPRNPNSVPDGFDGRNSVVVVPAVGSP